MPTIDEIHNNYSRKLDQIKAEHSQRVDDEMEQIGSEFSFKATPVQPGELTANFNRIESIISKRQPVPPSIPTQIHALVNITNSDPLQKLDNSFLAMFNLPAYYPVNKINYKTILCDSLEEFFGVFSVYETISDQERKRKISEAVDNYKRGNEICLGVNVPGQGCYVNGWQIAKQNNINPIDVRPQNDKVFDEVLQTAAHEKLGHGFITAYSALGELNTKMGLTLVQIASQFGIAPADDPVSQLRLMQRDLLFGISKFLEEGWATWIEYYLKEKLFNDDNEHPFKHPYYDPKFVEERIKKLPRAIKVPLLQAFKMLFGEEDLPMSEIFRAITYLRKIDNLLYHEFANILGQPLRYILGELLCMQCEANLGVECVPYAILIAANVTLDPVGYSFEDLRMQLEGGPRFNPDTRLAAISRIKLAHPGDIKELNQRVVSELGLTIPVEIR